MKTNKYILFCLFLLYLLPAKATDIPKDEEKYVTISGIVRDKSGRRRLFSTSYAVVSEMVVTDIEPSTTDIPIREAFGKDQILSDDASLFFDKDFWGNYNIIKPVESLEKAVGKLRKMQKE